MPPIMNTIVSRSILRHSLPTFRSTARRRFLSTAPPANKSRSWKSSAVRWGLAVGGVYYYNTSNVFAEEPAYSIAQPSETDESTLPTLDSLSPSRKISSMAAVSTTLIPPPTSPPSTPDVVPTSDPSDPPRTPEEYEEEAGQQGAFNEETGEINWDCSCLGGMAHGPCGEEFRAAFSCFIFSKEEPKGMDCIDRFKGMQECFREHPDVYGAELDDEEVDFPLDAESETPGESDSTPNASHALAVSLESSSSPPESSPPPPPRSEESDHPDAQTQRAKAATEQVAKDHGVQDESEELVPKAAHDATASQSGK